MSSYVRKFQVTVPLIYNYYEQRYFHRAIAIKEFIGKKKV